MTGSYFILSSSAGWRPLDTPLGLVLGEAAGVRLAEAPDPAPPVLYAEGFSRIGLPGGLAAAPGGDLYVSDAKADLIWRFDACAKSWSPLPSVGGEGDGPRQLKEPR